MIQAYLMLICSMLLWGTLPLFVSPIVSLNSAQIVLCRVVLGIIFLLCVFFLKKGKIHKEGIRKYGIRLLATGVFMGLNWVFLFESYRHVDPGISTLMYYLAPPFVMVGSVFLFRERFSLTKGIAVLLALGGMVITTGVVMRGDDPAKGILFGLLSALFYACVTLSNKSVSGLDGIEITLAQLFGAFLAMFPYVLATGGIPFPMPSAMEILCLVALGFVHTGVALWLYFSSIQRLPAQTVALCSYLDPASALVFTAVFLSEPFTLKKGIGAALILGGAVFGELAGKFQRRKT